jgi:hypothetical protein
VFTEHSNHSFQYHQKRLSLESLFVYKYSKGNQLMAMIIYSPNYSIDTIRKNFAGLGAQTPLATFISNNFSVVTSTVADTVNPANVTTPTPLNMSLVGQIYVDYGTGPVSMGITESLVLINNNVQTGSFNNGDIFNNLILSGGNVDFRYVTDAQGTSIVLANLQMTTLLPFAPSAMQTSYNATVLSIVRDLRNGVYNPNTYLSNIQYQSRQIAQQLITKYG